MKGKKDATPKTLVPGEPSGLKTVGFSPGIVSSIEVRASDDEEDRV